MGKSVEEPKVIMMISTEMVISIPEDDDDMRIFIVCENCKESFELADMRNTDNPLRMLAVSVPLLDKLIHAMQHPITCPVYKEMREYNEQHNT